MPSHDKDSVATPRCVADAPAADRHDVSGNRRKLLKASAAAVPAIMTLRSGAAMAVASIHQCTQQDALRAAQEQPAQELLASQAADEWVRVSGWRVEDKGSIYYCVKQDTGDWLCYDANGTAVTDADILKKIEKDAGDTSKSVEVNLLCYMQFVDGEPTGAITHYPRIAVINDLRATAVTGSCLASMTPDFNLV